MKTNSSGHSARPRSMRLAEAALADHMDLGDSFMAAWTLDELDRDADLDSVRSAWSRYEQSHA